MNINVWDVFRHKNKSRQRKVTSIEWNDIYYNDWIRYWVCSKQHFLSSCPNVNITKRDIDIAIKLSRECWWWYFQKETINWTLID